MQAAELRDSGALLGTGLDEVAELARDVHRAAAGRIFGRLGPLAEPVRLMHDSISALAYGWTRLGVRMLPALAGEVAAALRPDSLASAHDHPHGHRTLNALSGWCGDRLVEQRPALAARLSLRSHEGPLRTVAANVAHDAGDVATGDVVIFLHGLCETDRFWHIGARRNYGDPLITYGSLLRDEAGWTPLYASYNTGLHISANGRLLADLLDDLVGTWPVPVARIALVGHSMGGLVARSAVHQGDELGQDWVELTRHVVGLGAPHLGAPLERYVNNGTHCLARLPETRPFATWLNRRSVGIKDLRFGSVVEADWHGVDPDERLVDRCTPARLRPGVTYSVVSVTLSRQPHGPLAHDLLVPHSSAHAIHAGRGIAFEPDRMLHVGRRHHFDLLGDPRIYRQLRDWLR